MISKFSIPSVIISFHILSTLLDILIISSLLYKCVTSTVTSPAVSYLTFKVEKLLYGDTKLPIVVNVSILSGLDIDSTSFIQSEYSSGQ